MGVRTVSPTGIEPTTISRARSLRRTMTDGEKKLWAELRGFKRHFGIHVRRQAPIGPCIADFAIHDLRLVIEVDGEHHFQPGRRERERRRDRWLTSQGYRVLRFTTGELSDAFEGCVEEILKEAGVA